jgi:hypothetical protein
VKSIRDNPLSKNKRPETKNPAGRWRGSRCSDSIEVMWSV